jgi:hypothetical protein
LPKSLPSVDPRLSLINSRNALLRWSREDPKAPDAAPALARAGLRERFRREAQAVADACGETLSPGELDRRAECLRKAHYKDLALKSADARRARARKAAPTAPDAA